VDLECWVRARWSKHSGPQGVFCQVIRLLTDMGASLKLRGVRGDTKEGIPQGLKPQISGIAGRPKAEALGYLDARTAYPCLYARTPCAYLDARTPYGELDARTLRAAGVVFALLVSCLCLTACAPPRSSRIAIGAKNFTEQVVLGELVAQEIEAVTGQAVERRFYLAGSYLCQQALVSGRIDGYVEYTGTALTAILKQPLPPVGQRDEATVFRRVSELYASRYQVKVGRGLGFEDTFAMAVRGEDARRLGLKTISDAVRVSPRPDGWRLGVGYEFESRPDGLRGLEATYGLKFAGAPRTMDLGLLYRALSSGQVDMVAGNSTDGPIRALGFVVLEDDRHYFPPYEAVPVVLADSLRRHPGIQVAMDRLAGKVSAEEVRGMNYAVDSEHRDVGDVVREFRKGKGL
jgi:osmoprotectant transport system substrate-binding protein